MKRQKRNCSQSVRVCERVHTYMPTRALLWPNKNITLQFGLPLLSTKTHFTF